MKKFSILFNLCLFVSSMFCSSFVNALDIQSKDQEQKPCSSLQYGSFYTTNNTIVAPEHAIPFDCETLCHTKGIEHPKDSGDFILKEPGVYRVTYSVSLKEEEECEHKEERNKKVALTLNGHVVHGSEMFVSEEQLSTVSLLIKVCGSSCCDHVLRVINNNPLIHGWNNICLRAGPHHDNVTASILIEKVTNCSSTDCCCR